MLNANDWFLKATGEPRPFDIANQWAGSFGGPIKRDKLFFFFDAEGLRVLIPQVLFVTIPSLEFETATTANLTSISNSANGQLSAASLAFYQSIFNLYNNVPGASSAIEGSFDGTNGCGGPRYGSFLSDSSFVQLYYLPGMSPEPKGILRTNWELAGLQSSAVVTRFLT